MQYIIAALIITSGLVFVGLSQRYDFQDGLYRIDRFTGEMVGCAYNKEVKQNVCELILEGTGIFKNFNAWEK